ncbi:beta-ketoacyl synthase N-terminal-like domain-containing protein [Lentzea sp. DG1S-22]|uniref:beta-ketoacyl synthase N-terminal-like domain-containing protein n=1 Tax=Lentzea sp. DG1S-22 TaxID=3108822 RepID=UPI002E78B29C|nr:beta-ketoacyl synthase N-terminal-like domain-containing protein [Lentzea sp. DG1S-22]WVH83436.1 beta-ketoacyl synthase N-terminal-like domain-containing protein [Lentzea sp. DG1S-22]
MTASAGRAAVAVRAATVLTPSLSSLDQLADVLLSDGDPPPVQRDWVGLLDDPDVHHLGAEDAARVRRAARSSADPAKTAAVVAVRCAREAGLAASELAGCALIVAGNNLAMDYQARTVLDEVQGTRRVRPTHAVAYQDTDAVGVVSELLDLRAEGWTVGAASASGAVAVIQAMRLLRAGDAQRCMVVAPAGELSSTERRALSTSGALHPGPEPVCRPFDDHREGFVPGPAAAAVVLELAGQTAQEPLAVLLGAGQRLDARHGAAPDSAGQAEAMRAAMLAAGIEPADVGYLSAHATGSRVGDECEARAIAQVFGVGAGPLVNSTKAFLGHALTAAGLVELIATVVQLRHGRVHGNPNTSSPMPDVGGRLAGRTSSRLDRPVALTNSFGFSGINTSIALTTETIQTREAR